MKFPKKKIKDYSKEAINERVDFLSEKSGQPIQYINGSSLDTELGKGNIENMIGFAQMPLGVVGPVKINGNHARGDFFVPFATTEGALVASYNRGARVLSLSGGINVLVMKDQIQRAPFFVLENVLKAKEFVDWVHSHFSQIRDVAQSSSKRLKLEGYNVFVQGRIVYLRLNFYTSDAMGMNMITKASYEICAFVEQQFPVEKCIIESNMAVDKKPSHINTVLGRGKTVTSEAFIEEKVISRVLRTTAEEIDLAYKRQVTGGQLAGAMGSNGQLANGIAATFIACGQDVANVSESCNGYIYTETIGKDLYLSLSIPSLIVGTVGGGVSLPTQRECLEMMGCYGSGKALKFAEIIGATMLTGEISLAAAIVAGDFVSAHEKLGKNRPSAKSD